MPKKLCNPLPLAQVLGVFQEIQLKLNTVFDLNACKYAQHLLYLEDLVVTSLAVAPAHGKDFPSASELPYGSLALININTLAGLCARYLTYLREGFGDHSGSILCGCSPMQQTQRQ